MIILPFLCLSFESLAQYNLLRRGQVYNESDSAVAIEISEYRKIRLKVLTADTLFQAYKFELRENENLRTQLFAKDSTLQTVNDRHVATIQAKDETIKQLSLSFNDLETVSKKMRIFKPPLADTATKILIGVGLGIIVRSLIR